MGMFEGKPQEEPFYSGEVFHLWSYLYSTKEYQTTTPRSDPNIGDKTFPSPFEASNIPSTRLCSPPLN